MGSDRKPSTHSRIGGSGGTNCATLTFETVLNSPNVKVLSGVNKGEFLEIAVDANNVLQVRKGNDVAGAITSTQSSSLLACLQAGFRFNAQVKSIDGGKCIVIVVPT